MSTCKDCRFWNLRAAKPERAPGTTMGRCELPHSKIWAGVPVEVSDGLAEFWTQGEFGCIEFAGTA